LDFGIFNLMGYRSAGASTREILEDAAVARWQLRVATSLRYREELQQGHMIMGDRPFKDEQTMEQILSSQMIGDVDTCIERGVDEIRKTGVNHISLYFQIGDYAHNKARRSLERFIGEVVPGIERELGPLRKLPSMAVPDAWQ
jgi:hypothetical protein